MLSKVGNGKLDPIWDGDPSTDLPGFFSKRRLSRPSEDYSRRGLTGTGLEFGQGGSLFQHIKEIKLVCWYHDFIYKYLQSIKGRHDNLVQELWKSKLSSPTRSVERILQNEWALNNNTKIWG